MNGEPLNVNQAQDITTRYLARRENLPDEDEFTAMMVVLLNYGNHLAEVHCIGGEWSGLKGQATAGPGVPTCPNGHPLIERAGHPQLGMVRP